MRLTTWTIRQRQHQKPPKRRSSGEQKSQVLQANALHFPLNIGARLYRTPNAARLFSGRSAGFRHCGNCQVSRHLRITMYFSFRDNLRQRRVFQEDDLGGVGDEGLRPLNAVVVNIKQDVVAPVNNPPVSLGDAVRCQRGRRQARQENQELSHFFNTLNEHEVNGQCEPLQTGAAHLARSSSDCSTLAH